MLSQHRIAFQFVLSSLAWVIAEASALPIAAVAGEWVDVTSNVGGEKWGAYGVHYMKAVPGSEAVIAGVSECGLWSTSDGGATWTKLGPPIPLKPNGITYSDKGKSFYVWQMADNLKRPAQSIVRWNEE